MSKTCSQCNETKPLSDFKAHKPSKDGHYWRCKPCEAIYQRQWYLKNRESHKKKAIEVNMRRKAEWQEKMFNYLLEKPCVDCGEANPLYLDFDHLGGKEYNISTMLGSTYSWDAIMAEVAKCEVRCIKCHRLMTAKRGNHYRYRKAVELGLI